MSFRWLQADFIAFDFVVLIWLMEEKNGV